MKPKFVISTKKFETIKEAEDSITGWLSAGQFDQKMRLYKIAKVYRPIIKFKEVKCQNQ
jgi:hypothetical protein